MVLTRDGSTEHGATYSVSDYIQRICSQSTEAEILAERKLILITILYINHCVGYIKCSLFKNRFFLATSKKLIQTLNIVSKREYKKIKKI